MEWMLYTLFKKTEFSSFMNMYCVNMFGDTKSRAESDEIDYVQLSYAEHRLHQGDCSRDKKSRVVLLEEARYSPWYGSMHAQASCPPRHLQVYCDDL